ncbi:MAG: 16S rRNA (cytosine(1402)-N(4))-methyltransferase RsmH [Actinomycetota bacterium]|nr:16S rRNA (cytosine(1402)-N(4))-methyltransferase RsmH [Actinomycetota bacterium]MDK1016417.1 16S rRNA (cytosine(1402)-N(4))-methyltransferase RsmH [Actinomycetota bacterium]MDK1026151.1 16S rRNA (cytosine(1402)-N(4))-methyltransferase RsmH [Actinomycetota bacterium]MDK1037999.1 16S rRNA (cytosine(1402)-N(4))-methyltransferase RsmH [Actinomycetota bacterium]MDK1096083.1 16S rRNA (cytosine(1402)-N(4))-methyltransferase RsmH [Actinomycetota bacterium]
MDQPTSHNQTYHTPVMVPEVLSWLEPAARGWIVDCTYGGGGHSRAILDTYPDARIVAIDRDPDAVRQAGAGSRITVVQANYRDLVAVLARPEFPDRVDGILCDLGVSSHQLDTPDRGFSYHRSGPLDMRMGPDANRSAADLVNTTDEQDLATIFRTYGEEKHARRIAAAIVQQRPFDDTVDLAGCIADAVPAAARRSGHPARKVFQAIRIAVNEELAGIVAFMDAAFDSLAQGGRLVVIAYHSLEDRIVKRAFQNRARTCTCPPDIPVCVCGVDPDFEILTPKAIRTSTDEIERNPRSRSAVLRVGERIS